MTPGRNDPCRCGSGKKYKLCCLRAAVASLETPEMIAWRRVRRALDEFHLPRTLFGFVTETYGPAALDEAWAEFSGLDDPLDADTPHMPVFMPWLFHRWSPDPHGPSAVDAALHDHIPTQLFLERATRRLDPIVRRYLEACLEAPFGFHEILRCDPGHGFRTRELFTGEELEVMEQMGSRAMQRGDLLFGQLVTVDNVTILEASAPCLIPPIRKIELIDFRRQLLRGADRCSREALRDRDLELLQCYLELIEDVLDPPRPQLQNTDGEPLELHRLVFEIESAQAAFAALKDLDFDRTDEELLAEAKRTGSGELKRVKLDWKKPGNQLHESWTNTVLGHLEIKERQLIAEVNSAVRAQALKALVVARLGDHARLRSDRIQSIEKAMAGGRIPSPAGEAPAAEQAALAELPEVQVHIQKMMAGHFERWVSQEIPALDGRTPLDAIRNPDGREKVLALVIDAERHARAMTPTVDEAVLQRVRERLGLRDV